MISIRNYIIRSRYYILSLIILMLVFYFIKSNYMENILNLDGTVSHFIQNHLVNDTLTPFFKIITNLGDVIFFMIFILLTLLFFKGKGYFTSISLNLLQAYLVSAIFKNVFMRERPAVSLIKKPIDYSFPSGHTMCSVAFYGFLIYLINKNVKNKTLKYILITLCILTIVLIGFSRLYLNVHYFTDVICGGILGLICLLMFINYVKIRNII